MIGRFLSPHSADDILFGDIFEALDFTMGFKRRIQIHAVSSPFRPYLVEITHRYPNQLKPSIDGLYELLA